MQSRNFNVYAHRPVQILAKKARYFDFKQFVTPETDMTYEITMQAYTGLTAQFKLDSNGVQVVEISSGTLPDGTTFSGFVGVLKPVGKYLDEQGHKYQGILALGLVDTGLSRQYSIFYKSGEVVLDVVDSKEGYVWVGEITIPQHTLDTLYKMNFNEVGTISYNGTLTTSFATNNYLISSQNLPAGQYFAPTLRLVTRVTTHSNVSLKQILFWDASDNYHGIGLSSSNLMISCGTETRGGSISGNSTYWLMFVQDAHDGSKLYYLPDNDTYTEETLPDVSDWSLAISLNMAVFDIIGVKLLIGGRVDNSYFRGSIDLLHTKIEVGSRVSLEENEISWSPYWRALS